MKKQIFLFFAALTVLVGLLSVRIVFFTALFPILGINLLEILEFIRFFWLPLSVAALFLVAVSVLLYLALFSGVDAYGAMKPKEKRVAKRILIQLGVEAIRQAGKRKDKLGRVARIALKNI